MAAIFDDEINKNIDTYNQKMNKNKPVAANNNQYEMTSQQYNGTLDYADSSLSVHIDSIWYSGTHVYVAHVMLSDPYRFHTVATGGTAAGVAANYGAILTVNGDYGTPCGYPNIRDGVTVNPGNANPEAVYTTGGQLMYGPYFGWGNDTNTDIANGAKDTFQF